SYGDWSSDVCSSDLFVAISQAYRRLNYPDKLNYADVVYNGIDVDLYKFDPNSKREYLLFLGRICKDKGTAPSIEIARRLGLPLKIGRASCRERVQD